MKKNAAAASTPASAVKIPNFPKPIDFIASPIYFLVQRITTIMPEKVIEKNKEIGCMRGNDAGRLAIIQQVKRIKQKL